MAGGATLNATSVVSRYRRARLRFFRFRYEADTVTKIALALGFAGLTGIAAQVRVPLPFTPVPVTLQTFAVLLAGIALGMTYGGLSQGLYAGLGAAGVPWFTGMSAGVGHIVGPTGGYLVGFVVAAVAVGYLTDRYVRVRRLPALLAVLFAANFVIIHGLGLVVLGLWLALFKGAPPTLVELLMLGTVPFIPGDIVKLVGAAVVGVAIAPGEAFAVETRPDDRTAD